jgi:transposase
VTAGACWIRCICGVFRTALRTDEDHMDWNDKAPRCSSTTEARRRRAVELFERGMNGAEIGRELGVTREAVRQWIAAYREKGLAGVAAKPRLGASPKLSRGELPLLGTLLAQGAKAHGFESEEWTTPRVAALILARFNVQYHPDHVGRLLRRNGLDWQLRAAGTEDPDAVPGAARPSRASRPRRAPTVFLLWGMRPRTSAARKRAA